MSNSHFSTDKGLETFLSDEKLVRYSGNSAMNQDKYRDNHIATNLKLKKTNEKDSIINVKKDSIIKVVLEKYTSLTKEWQYDRDDFLKLCRTQAETVCPVSIENSSKS